MNMTVTYVRDMHGDEVRSKYGFEPAGFAGESFEVPFDLGARLVAAGFALPSEEEAVEEPDAEDED